MHDATTQSTSQEVQSPVQPSQETGLEDGDVHEASNTPKPLPGIPDRGGKAIIHDDDPAVSPLKTPEQPFSRTAIIKPFSQQQKTNPRDFELQQLRKRFAPAESISVNVTVLSFDLIPTDPDFPFELDGLHCALHVPASYPAAGKPRLRVNNAEMERGFQINVEKGFDELVERYPGKSLLALLNELDKSLEAFLTSRKTQTIKLVPNSAVVKLADPRSSVIEQQPKAGTSLCNVSFFTSEQEREAAERRATEVRQLEARLGRHPLFSKSGNGTDFIVPLNISQPGRLPVELQSIKEVSLFIPLHYSLEPCTINLKGHANSIARNVEKGFTEYSQLHANMSLLAKLNYLSQNMHILATLSRGLPNSEPSSLSIPAPPSSPPTSSDVPPSASDSRPIDPDKPHVHRIPRPPEWDV